MVATQACLSVAQLTLQSSISPSSCQLRMFNFSRRLCPVSRITARRNFALEELSRVPWTSDVLRPVRIVRRPLLRRSSDRQITNEDPVKSVSVLEDGTLEGVIRAEREGLSQPTWGRICALGGGDLMFLLIFSVIGRLSHGFPALDWETVRTAHPFIAGWFLGSYFTGGYGSEGQGLKGLKVAGFTAVKSWAVGVLLAVTIQGFSTGHIPSTPFILVSLASTLILLVGWRTAFTAVFPNDKNSLQEKMGNRKGGAFEFFELLTSLVKRW